MTKAYLTSEKDLEELSIQLWAWIVFWNIYEVDYIIKRDKRTLQQNKYLHLLLQNIAYRLTETQGENITLDQAKIECKWWIHDMYTKYGKYIPLERFKTRQGRIEYKSTSNLDIDEFTIIIQAIHDLCRKIWALIVYPEDLHLDELDFIYNLK